MSQPKMTPSEALQELEELSGQHPYLTESDKHERLEALAVLRQAVEQHQSWQCLMVSAKPDQVRVTELEAERDALTTDNAELNHVFDLRWKADMRAVERWRAEDPEKRQLTLPDHADLCVWLLEERDALGERVALLDVAVASAQKYEARAHEGKRALEEQVKAARDGLTAFVNCCGRNCNPCSGCIADAVELKAKLAPADQEQG